MSLGRGQLPEQLVLEVAQIRGEEVLEEQRTADSYYRNIALADSVKHNTRRGSVYMLIGIILIALFFGIIWFVF
jgi:hypothetical protein